MEEPIVYPFILFIIGFALIFITFGHDIAVKNVKNQLKNFGLEDDLNGLVPNNKRLDLDGVPLIGFCSYLVIVLLTWDEFAEYVVWLML